jgi:hypothetical protein
MFGDDYSLASVSQAVQDGFGTIQVEAYGANKGFEQTWYSAKNGENKQFEKLIPGVNTYT